MPKPQNTRVWETLSTLTIIIRPYIKWIVIIVLLFISIYYMKYLVLSTPFPVYVLDRLNIRELFLPDITCDRCNNFTYDYIIENRNACANQDVFLLLAVMSYHANVQARTVIRQTWGGVKEYRGYHIKTMFIFGTHQDKNLNNQMQYELDRFGDIVQANFADNYRSLSNKSMLALGWVAQHCGQAKYVLKTDDDSFNVPQRYVDHLIHVKTEEFIGGYCFTVTPDRRTGSKFYTSEDAYPDVYYPTYCAGPGYILSQRSVQKIVHAAPNVKYITMEDVFVTGLCRVVSGQTYIDIPGTVVGQSQMSKCDLATWVKNGHNIVPQRTEQLWQLASEADGQKDCISRNSRLFMVLVIMVLLWSRLILCIIKER